jgi:hypothetical protein
MMVILQSVFAIKRIKSLSYTRRHMETGNGLSNFPSDESSKKKLSNYYKNLV